MRESVIDRRVKELLLRIAREKLSPHELAEWLYDEYGIRVKADWKTIERAILRAKDVRGQELAVLLLEKGVAIPEQEWISIATRYERSVPRDLHKQGGQSTEEP